MGVIKDRFGHPRYEGYNQKDFIVCLLCNPSGEAKHEPSSYCKKCGGYGEVPISKGNEK